MVNLFNLQSVTYKNERKNDYWLRDNHSHENNTFSLCVFG